MTPGRAIMTMRSANFAAMLRSWLIIRTVIPFSAARSRSSSVTWIWCLTSRLDVGSSRMRTLGVWASPLAIATFWCCPAESSSKFLMARCLMPIMFRVRLAILMSRSLVLPNLWCGYLPMSTVSRTVMLNASLDVTGT